MEFGREDWILVLLVISIAAAIGYSGVIGGNEFSPETEVERYCVNVADTLESNSSLSGRISGCRCIPPSRVNESRFTAPSKVENATKLFVVECTYDDGSKDIFPIRRTVDMPGNKTSGNLTGNVSIRSYR
ncbi:MAG: hypothetical protein SVQ76_00705 [Candidatus Nanohaloarchaea archaeon]|nr:hypothetical protein [Candidatus Nanohaloarchaea archaeon]